MGGLVGLGIPVDIRGVFSDGVGGADVHVRACGAS